MKIIVLTLLVWVGLTPAGFCASDSSLALTISADKPVYAPGETITVFIRLKNTGKEDVTLQSHTLPPWGTHSVNWEVNGKATDFNLSTAMMTSPQSMVISSGEEIELPKDVSLNDLSFSTSRDGKPEVDRVFSKPGQYSLVARYGQNVISNPIVIEVKETAQAEEGAEAKLLTSVEERLRLVLEQLEPAPEVVRLSDTVLSVKYKARQYMVHGRHKTGEVGDAAVQRTGPDLNGFILNISVQPAGYANQMDTPQTVNEPYWKTDLEVTMHHSGVQLYWALSYGAGADPELLARLRAVLRKFEQVKGVRVGERPCRSDEACADMDCSQFDSPVKEGYNPSCEQGVCRCMCHGCE